MDDGEFPEELDDFLAELQDGGGEQTVDFELLREVTAERDSLRQQLLAMEEEVARLRREVGYELIVHAHEFPFFGIDYPLGELLVPAGLRDKIQSVHTVTREPEREFTEDIEIPIAPRHADWMIMCIKIINQSGKDLAIGLSCGGTLVVRNHPSNCELDNHTVAKVLACKYPKEVQFITWVKPEQQNN
jgi:hypothetical protein